MEDSSHFNAQFYNQSPGCFSFKQAQFVGKSGAFLHFVSSEHRWLRKDTFPHTLCHLLRSGLYLQDYFLTHLISLEGASKVTWSRCRWIVHGEGSHRASWQEAGRQSDRYKGATGVKLSKAESQFRTMWNSK